MRLFIFRLELFTLRAIRRAFSLVLIASLTCGPAFASDPLATAALGGGSGQAGAQNQNANNNSLAANLGKAASVLSMAAGGLYIAKGAQQMKCCASGCTGNGDASQKTKDELDKKTKDKAGSVIPTTWNQCPSSPHFASPFKLFAFFEPPQADAALGPCLDALIALTTGGLMMLNGILGLQAANQSNNMANNSLNNGGNMGSLSGGAGTSPTPGATNNGTGTSNLAGSNGKGADIKLDPALLRTGTANDIMGQFEKKFGIPRDQFANGVLGGEDPRKLLGAAPMNALSNADMNKATNSAKAMSDADKAKALSGTPLTDAQRELASKMGTGSGNDAYAVNSAAGGTPGNVAFGKKKDSEKDDAESEAPKTDVPELSPELQAALAAKEHDDRMNGITDLTIFEVVHRKYREKSKMIFGYDPDGGAKGGQHNGI